MSRLSINDINYPHPLRLDLLIEGQIIIEVKSTLETHSIYNAQLLTYIK